jgi:RNA polymerase sigma factor (sigma-70 family)
LRCLRALGRFLLKRVDNPDLLSDLQRKDEAVRHPIHVVIFDNAGQRIPLGFFPARRLIDVQQTYEAVLLSAGPPSAPGHQFEELFFEHYPRLVKTLLRLTGNSGQAEELAADAFYKLHQHRSQQQADENPAGWLYRTAMNLGLDALRSNSRRVRREEQAQRAASINDTAGNPLYGLLAEEQRERVRAVIARLKPIHGQVLLMGSSGFTSKEIAAVLGVKLDSLYVLISRAKAQFEKEYTGLFGRSVGRSDGRTQ